MDKKDLSNLYNGYIACLNKQDWSQLARFLTEDVRHNGRAFGLAGYRAMLERNFQDIPDLRFHIALLVSEPPIIASRLQFDCTPRADFLGLPINGQKISFTENVFYTYRDSRIAEVWSVIDKAGIEAQLAPQSP